VVEAGVVTGSGARIAAEGMLAKLMRDGRIGGRHRRFEDAHAHHFADGEKECAERVADFLERDGIFMPKINICIDNGVTLPECDEEGDG
jgi:hypothetical protein